MKDYSKLRPFDLEKFKAGEQAIFLRTTCPEVEVRAYVAGPDINGAICVKDSGGRFLAIYVYEKDYRLAPLAWVRKSADEDVLWPVYKGDVLYSSFFKSTFEVTGVDGFGQFKAEKYATLAATCFESCSFTPPKVKREGWINIYSQKSVGGIIYASKREAEESAVASGAVQLHIEWEE